MRIKESFFSHRSKLLLYSLATATLYGCGGESESGNSSLKPVDVDAPVQVVAKDALFNTELAQDDFVVDLYDVVLKDSDDNAFKLTNVVSVNSNDPTCNVSSIDEYSFTVPRKQARVCDYNYQIATLTNSAYSVSSQSSTDTNTAMVRVVVSNANSTELPPLSQIALVNDSSSVYQPVSINLLDELLEQGMDVSNMALGGSVSQPFGNASIVNVDTGNDKITYTPALGFTGLDRLMYSYTDSANAIAYSGTIDIVVSNSANQGILVLNPDVTYDTGKGYVSLENARTGFDIDVSPYVSSIDGDALQLIYVHSMSAPHTRIKASNANNPANMEFFFQTSVQKDHSVTYVVSDKKGAYAIGHLTIVVLDEDALPTWTDITHPASGTLFFAPKGINELVANSYLFTDLFNVSQSGANYLVGRLNSNDLLHYCDLLGAEIATAAELKSLVDRGWTTSSKWPNATTYLVKEDLSSSVYKLMDISLPPYTIDRANLDDPTSALTSYFPACVLRGKRMLTSLALSAAPPTGTTSLVVAQGYPIAANLSGYYNDGSHESDMIAYDQSLANYVQSTEIFEVKGNQLTGKTVGTTDVHGEYDASNDPLRSNKLSMEVTNAVVTSGTLHVSSNSVPLGAEITLTGEINFSDGTKKQLHEAGTSIKWINSTAGNELTGSSLVTVNCDTSSCKARANSTTTGYIELTWRSGSVSATAQTINVNGAQLVSLDSITASDVNTSVVTDSYPLGRKFKLTISATYTNGTRDVSTDPSANWNFDNTHFDRDENRFSGLTIQNSSPITFQLGSKTLTKNIKLTSAYITGVEITETNVSRPQGLSHRLTSRVIYSDGSASTGNGIPGCTWSSSNHNVATVDQSGQVLASSNNIGNANIKLSCVNSYNQSYSDSAVFNVTNAIAMSMTVSAPNGTETVRHHRLAFKAVADMSDGTSVDVTNRAAWSLSHAASGVSVDKGVVFTPMNHDSSYAWANPQITASLDGSSDSIRYTVDNDLVFGNDYYWIVPIAGTWNQAVNFCNNRNGFERPGHNDIQHLRGNGVGGLWTTAFSGRSKLIWESWRDNNSAYNTSIETGIRSYDYQSRAYTMTCIKK
ncbi:Ig-like domain-containing protein [Vibrio sp. F13]|uniref:Ig-like domain-containing protein n=1 Tax=Vibrio sp. F13 TaxID=2070777 RepID=UPI0010BE19A1|nr:Ig-like domain-containing protein [Vibrio sp. F13]TKG02870.1 hypothetical protein FCV76_07215 [Vibrio sp. F13]